MALVPYNPLPVTEFFNTTERKLNIQGLPDIVISQDWNKFGVAAVVWEAALVLGTFLQSIEQKIQGKQVLELGTGTGVCGIVASILGANVTFTDLEDCLDPCRTNIENNLNSSKHAFRITSLNWKENLTKNWSGKWFDYIIGADLVYIEDLFEDLIRVFQYFSDINENIEIFLSGQIRYEKRFSKFKTLLHQSFKVEYLLEDGLLYNMKITKTNKI